MSGFHAVTIPANAAVAAAATATSIQDSVCVCHMPRSCRACCAALACRVFCFSRSKRT